MDLGRRFFYSPYPCWDTLTYLLNRNRTTRALQLCRLSLQELQQTLDSSIGIGTSLARLVPCHYECCVVCCYLGRARRVGDSRCVPTQVFGNVLLESCIGLLGCRGSSITAARRGVGGLVNSATRLAGLAASGDVHVDVSIAIASRARCTAAPRNAAPGRAICGSR